MTTETSELKNRVEAKLKEVDAKIAELKADSKEDSRKRLEELEQKRDDVKNMISNGWDQMSEGIAGKLNQWLKDS